ncbi:LysR family transcriptional regulator [Neorhizobium sp. JUb45]|uniref:LysR family transcriptional regulator n=1 Tax=unclassified Neorhizobium TaxID=2629175 RepID=UPI00104AC473|nr:LysR family transcriptional regulator [Neorhizobium sp. JUb45]TCR00497.1 DNA-binding transcriptional LysR family regulator [Neorhizobium sp. JUb45]
MKRDELGDLIAFLTVAEERSFTRAAALMGTSQSSLSHTVRRLEERMDVRLLTRTTRNVVATEAGEKLMSTLRPAFNEISHQMDALSAMRQRPGGNIRITSSRHAAETILMPAVKKLLADYPGINVEISIEQRFVDLVSERYDAGVRLGESIEKDMIAVRIGPELRMVVAGSPEYFKKNQKPQTPQDLTQHRCINLRLPTLGGLYTWEFEREGRPVNVRVDGQFVCNDVPMIIDAALGGIGLTCLPDDHLGPLVRDGRLIQVLEDWCDPFPGYHLYYPSRRLASPAFALLVDALRYRAD